MSILQTETTPLANSVAVSEDEIVVSLVDGRTISVPLAWFPRLLNASTEERADFRLLGGGEGIHWPQIDEDINVGSLLRGAPRQRPSAATTEEYRRGEDKDTWHWCKQCRSYPEMNYLVRRTRPSTGELCNECAAKFRSGTC